MNRQKLGLAGVWLAAACGLGVAAGAEGSGRNEIVIPAISFAAQGGGEKELARTEKSIPPDYSFIHFWYTPDHWLEWTIDDAAAGDYQVTVKYAGRFAVKRGLALNGSPVPGLESFTLAPTGISELKGGWMKWSEATLPAPVKLSAGRNVLRMTCLDSSSVRLGPITLTAEGKSPVTIEAASFTGQGGGRAGVHIPPRLGQVGREWQKSWNEPGKWLEWNVECPAAGRYQVGLHYRADGYCRLELQVNGEKAKGLEDFIPPRTGEFDIYHVGILPEPIALRQGGNTLRLTVLGGPKKVVPQFDGMFGLSAINLAPLPEGASPRGEILTLSTMDELKRPWPEDTGKPASGPTGPPLPKLEGAIALEKGQSFALGSLKVTVVEADTLPFVENQYTKTSIWDRPDNPMLKEIRERFGLDEVVAAGKDEFEKQMLLGRWIWEQWDHGHAQELYYLTDPLRILQEAKKEHIFQCMHSGGVVLSAMASMGWISRHAGHSTHTWNEIWSNQHRKWYMFDATSNLRHERHGMPLDTYENLYARHVAGKTEGIMAFARDGKSWPVAPKKGEATMSVRNTNFLDRKKAAVPSVKIKVGEGITPDVNPQDLYYPVNQAALTMAPEGQALKVAIGTMTPNFKEFQVRIDGGEWRQTEPSFAWPLHGGRNRLEAKSVNQFGVDGPVATVVLQAD